MKVTSETQYADFVQFEPYLTDEGRKQLVEAAKKQFGEYTDLTIEKFNELTQLTTETVMRDYSTVFGVYWLKGFKDFIEDFTKTIQNFSLKPNAMEASAASVCYPTSMIEAMLTFSRSYFNLPSFAEAAKTTLGDYLIARKDDYNGKAFERRMSELQMQKIKNKQ